MDATQARTPSPLPEVPQPPLVEAEEWRLIDSHPWYEVSTLGRVRRIATGRIMRPALAGGRYLSVGLCGETQTQKLIRINRLVLLVFRGTPPNGYEGNHIDGNKMNNALTNLEWVTRHENMQHWMRIGHPKYSRGEDHPSAKLSEDQVREIRRQYANGGLTHAKIAPAFGVAPRTIGSIVANQRWRHIPNDESRRNSSK